MYLEALPVPPPKKKKLLKTRDFSISEPRNDTDDQKHTKKKQRKLTNHTKRPKPSSDFGELSLIQTSKRLKPNINNFPGIKSVQLGIVDITGIVGNSC